MPDPKKFSNFSEMITAIHDLGLYFGLYTSRSNNTCAGFAASCGHEVLDAVAYASWGVDFVKDDSCGYCRDVLSDYSIMQSAIWATARVMILSIEGEPPIANCSAGGFGNMRRVGHDLNDWYKSAVSLVDLGSGLWPYAHSDVNKSDGGFWNDFEILHVGNNEFSNGSVAAVVHFTMWCALKAPLLLGMDFNKTDAATLALVGNVEAIAVNQDPLGAPAHRVAVSPPANSTLGASAWDSVSVITPCALNHSTQTWRYRNASSGPRQFLYIVPCNAADPFQQWTFPGADGGVPGLLRNVGAGACVDAGKSADPAVVTTCNASSSAQLWTGTTDLLHISNPDNTSCLAVWDFSGPDVQVRFQEAMFALRFTLARASSLPQVAFCKSQSDGPASNANEVFSYDKTSGLITTQSGPVSGQCLGVESGPAGGQLVTQDGEGREWCLTNQFGGEGGWMVAQCASGVQDRSVGMQYFNVTVEASGGRTSLGDAQSLAGVVAIRGAPGPSYNNQFGGSGPVAHSRYVTDGGPAPR